MKNESQDISVIICTYTEERWNDLVAGIGSLKQQTVLPREIIVVIDHNPAMLERARAELSGVVVVENTEPRGLSGARNSGIAVAQGKYIAFLDDDATAEQDWLAMLSRCLGDPSIIGSGGAVDPVWQIPKPGWFPEEFFWVIGCSYRGMPKKKKFVRNPYGGCLLIRREIFEKIGGFQNGLGRIGTRPFGCEETELCIRVRQHFPESKFLYEPHARIHHQVPARRLSWSYFRSRCFAEGLSKAFLSRLVGAKDGLSAERRYTFRTLPEGVVRGIADTILRGDLQGLARAGAIIAGLAITTAGYLVGLYEGRQLVAYKKRNMDDQSYQPSTN